MKRPFVAVWMITYNHEDYIAQAIESVMMQKTSFPIKLYIGEDCSTDNTRNICIELEKKYPEKIKLLLNKKNDLIQNAKNVYDACFSSGAKYMALLDGDDFWTDPLKLQKQVDFLETNPEFAISFHNTEVIYTDGSKKSHLSNPVYNTNEFSIFDLINGERFQTVSCVFRYGLFDKLPSWFFDSPAGDFILHMLNTSKGKIKYFSEAMGAYRVHSNGLWSNLQEEERIKKHLKIFELLINYPFEEEIIESLNIQYINKTLLLYRYYFSKKDYSSASSALEKAKKITQIELIDNISWLHNEYIKLKQSNSFKISNGIIRFLKNIKNLIIFQY